MSPQPNVPRSFDPRSDAGGGSPRYLAFVMALLAVVSSLFAFAATSASAAGENIRICHAGNSDSNPYQNNPPADGSKVVGGHDTHNGPVWAKGMKAAGITWGDIIPPFNYTDDNGNPAVYPGKNWTLTGSEIHANNCNPVNPDLRILKTSSGNALMGTSGSYFLNVRNIGTQTAAGPFTVSDTMPLGVTATAAAGGAAWSCTVAALGVSISCVHAGALAPSTSAPQITVSIDWVTAGTKTNTATVTVLTDDPSANNTARVTNTIGAVVVPHNLALNVSKTSDASGDSSYNDNETAPFGGGQVTYRVEVENPTIYPLTIDSVTDVVDAAAGVPVTCDAALVGVGETSLGATLPANSTAFCYFTLTAPAAAGSSTTDTVTVLAHETADATNSIDDDDATTVTRGAAPTLSGTVAKSSDADGNGTYSSNEVTTAAAGTAVTFRALVTNTSTVTVDVGALSDVYGPGPAGLGTTITPTCLVAPPLTLAPGAFFTCQFTVPNYSPAAGSSTVDTFSAVLSRAGSTSVTPTGSATVSKAAAIIPIPPAPVLTPDLSIVKAGPTSAVKPGDNVPYTLTVTNIGNGSASNVQVTDTLPAAMTFVSASGTGFTCSGTSSISCQLAGSLAPGASAVVNVVAALSGTYASTAIANTAVVLPTDANPANNTSTDSTDVVLPTPPVDEDLGLSKTGLQGSVAPGGVLSWTVNVTNVKGTPAAGFTVTDVVPAGLTVLTVGGTDYGCSVAGQTVSCTYTGAPLPVGSSAAFQIDALVAADYAGTEVSNTAVVDPGGVDATNDSATAVTPVTAVITGGGGGGVTEPPAEPPAEGGSGPVLPFTGSYTDKALSAGVTLLMLGLFIAIAGRRRRSA